MPVTRSQSGTVRRGQQEVMSAPMEVEVRSEEVVLEPRVRDMPPASHQIESQERLSEARTASTARSRRSSKASIKAQARLKLLIDLNKVEREALLIKQKLQEQEDSDDDECGSIMSGETDRSRIEKWVENTDFVKETEQEHDTFKKNSVTLRETEKQAPTCTESSFLQHTALNRNAHFKQYLVSDVPVKATVTEYPQYIGPNNDAVYMKQPVSGAVNKCMEVPINHASQSTTCHRDVTYSQPDSSTATMPLNTPVVNRLNQVKVENQKPVTESESVLQKSSGDTINLSELASAIALAAQSGQQTKVPKYIGELPYFNGSHQDWLAFRAAYTETASYFSHIENTARLRRALKGRAKEAVNCLLIANAQPDEILRTLETRFGRPDSIALLELEQLRKIPKVSDAPGDICLFASKVQNSVATLQVLQRKQYLYNPEIIKALVEKLTPALRYRWYDFVTDNQAIDEPDLLKFKRFMDREASRCSQFAPPEIIKGEDRRQDGHRSTQRTFKTSEEPRTTIGIWKSQVRNQERPGKQCSICQEKDHWAQECEKFKNADNDERWQLAKQHKLCFRCLRYKSALHKCKFKRCEVDGCIRTHHPLLHNSKTTTEKGDETEQARVNTTKSCEQYTFLKILPVRITGPKGYTDTYALLDDGSTISLMDTEIAEKVGAHGPSEPLKILAVGGTKIDAGISRRVTISIQGQDEKEFEIKARTINRLRLAPQAVFEEDVHRCDHLKDIKNRLKYEGKPTVLLGQDNWHLLIADEVRKGKYNQPVASHTPLGWVLHGASSRSLGRRVHYCHQTIEDKLDEDMKRYFALESLGITPKATRADPNERALSMLRQKTVEMPEGKYETPLLWKEDNRILPNNYEHALKRLQNTESKLDKNPQLKISYEKQINDLIEKGYAEEAPPTKTPGKTWYLPHFAVLHPAKPGKVRVVFDAAARAGGSSLNDNLLAGPDLLQSLPGVLMRFRQHPIAVSADIEEMFLRIGIIEEDRDVLRFLWRENRREGTPKEFRMKSVIFGAACSPCTALFIKNLNAEKWNSEYPEAAKAIIQHHYMDDYLQSFQSEEEAIKIAKEVRHVHSKGNFNLRKWNSNRSRVLKELEGTSEGQDEKSEIKLDDGQKEGKILGLTWKPTTDTLGFNLNFARVPEEIRNGKRTPTKREALRTVMSLFDPLGLVSPITIQAKQILQETWRNGVGWDEEIPSEAAIKWKDWINELQKLENVNIPRCHPNLSTATEKEIHTFVDASETAYAAAVYWRILDETGTVHITLAAAKARVAPLKLTSIPRLELQAAVLGCRLAKMVTEEYQIKPNRRIFWSDSKTVLAWLRAGPRSFKSFVAHRVAEIEEDSTVKEWKWIPTQHNVADDATRNVPNNFGRNHRWFIGPEFLYQEPEKWPVEKEVCKETNEERIHVAKETPETSLSEALPDINKFSSWLRLIRTTARVLQFIELLKQNTESVNAYKRTRNNSIVDPEWKKDRKQQSDDSTIKSKLKRQLEAKVIEGELIQRAKELWIRASQQDSFPNEISALNNHKNITKDSRLFQYAVVLEEDKLKLKSRISEAEKISETQKQPDILDGEHKYTKLYIDWLHRKLHHGGIELVINEARQQFWILRLRTITRSIVKNCIQCRIRRAKPAEPPTGNHPHNRLAHHCRPFTYTGLDYFGPLSVTVGRSQVKRYVALFTCLTTRAVHLEIAANLSADSTISALRRMIARRGCPTEIYSDNGTNLHGANKEIMKALQEEASNRSIKWKFIPPSAPFMGGAWERLVRSVKTALYSVLQDRHPQEETLATLLCEVEYTVNSRPLTHVSTSPEDDEALTPNHFLLGGSGGTQHLGTFTDTDLKLRQQWRRAQRLADMFWDRWLKEYLPELQYRREPHGSGNPIKIGDLVFIVDTSMPRNTWPRGKIVKVYPGKDGIVRAADVQTSGGVLRRPTKRLIVLPMAEVSDKFVAPRS